MLKQNSKLKKKSYDTSILLLRFFPHYYYLLIHEGTFSVDIITTSMFLKADDSWNIRENPIELYIFGSTDFSDILKTVFPLKSMQ